MENKFLVAALVGIVGISVLAAVLYIMVAGSSGGSSSGYSDSRCAVSLCDCKCYPKGKAANVTASGEVCINNCEAWAGIKGCSYSDGKCLEIK